MKRRRSKKDAAFEVLQDNIDIVRDAYSPLRSYDDITIELTKSLDYELRTVWLRDFLDESGIEGLNEIKIRLKGKSAMLRNWMSKHCPAMQHKSEGPWKLKETNMKSLYKDGKIYKLERDS